MYVSYSIIRNEKYNRSSLIGLYRHNERKNTTYTNKNINHEKTFSNYSLKKCDTTYLQKFEQIRQEYNLQGWIKKNSNVVCEYIITSDEEYFESIGKDETKRFFKTAYEFVKNYKNLGEDYIISATVHLDEATPHMHLIYIPVVHTIDKKSKENSEKICCSDFWKGKDSYKFLQDNFHKYMTRAGFELERVDTKDNQHIKIEDLKKITNYENIKCELQNEPIQEIDTTNMQLVLAQNKNLQLYNKKLKGYLAQTLKSIEKAITLEQENQNLIEENSQLHNENQFLKKYIDKAYDYISILINIPKLKIKNMIDNFFKELKEK